MVMKWYFGIITDGRDKKTLYEVLASINAVKTNLDNVAICGNVNGIYGADNLISMPDMARDGRLGAMRNLLVDQRGDADIIVIMDDDIILDKNFIQGFDKFGYNDWDVASCKIRNPDGTRYWDWKIYREGMNWLIPYDQTSKHISLTGGLIVAKAYVFDKVCWNPSLGFYEKEDVAFSDLLKRHNFKIVFNPYSAVTHQGPYTQKGTGVYRTD